MSRPKPTEYILTITNPDFKLDPAIYQSDMTTARAGLGTKREYTQAGVALLQCTPYGVYLSR